MSGNLSFIFDRPIICKTIKYMYVDQSGIISWRVFGFKKYRLAADWSVEDMNSDMPPIWMLLDVSLSPK